MFLDFPSFSEHFIDTFDFVFKTGVVPGASYKEMDPDTGSLAKRMSQGDHSGVLKVEAGTFLKRGVEGLNLGCSPLYEQSLVGNIRGGDCNPYSGLLV